MDKKLYFVLLSFLVLFLSVSVVSASEDLEADDSVILSDSQDLSDIDNSNLTYNNLLILKAEAPDDAIYVDGSKESDGDGSSSAPYNNLQSALDSASDGSTIVVKAGTYSGEGNVGLTISTSSLTIQASEGEEVVFDGDYSSVIFTVAKTAKSLHLIDLTFTHGNSTKGGAINWKAQSGIIENCKFIDNIASTGGGAVYFTDNAKSSKIIGSTFKGNKVSSLTSRGGALFFEEDNVGGNSIVDSSFISNSAVRSAGAIYIYTDGDDTISNCIFTDNSVTGASGFGGAIQFVCDDLTLEGSNFTNNTAFTGGAVYVNGRDSSISNCNFIENTGVNGGALSIWGVRTTVSNSKFESNKAEKGSAIFNSYSSTVLNSNTFTSNQANSTSLSIYNSNGQFTVTLFGGDNLLNAIYNTADSITVDGASTVNGVENSNNGALLYQDERISGESITLQAYNGNTFVGTYTATTDIYGNVYYNVDANNLVASHSESSLYTEITNTYSDGNTYTDLLKLIMANILNGVADISLAHSYTYDASADTSFPSTGIEITDSININGNGFTLNGANLVSLFNIKADNVNISNLNIINHLSETSGGAIYWNGDNAKLTNVNFTNNKANNTFGLGGAVYFNGENTSIDSCTFTGNNASISGGAVYIGGSNSQVKNSKFISNKANSYGGAVFLDGSDSELSSNTFTSNSVDAMGGAVFLAGDNAKVNSNTFTSNSASSYGGAIYSSSNDATISTNTFNTNTANIHGGGMFLSTNTTLTTNTQNGNSDYAYITSDKVSNLKVSIVDSPISTTKGSNLKVNVSILDDNNNPISGSNVKVNLGGVDYTVGQLINGSALLTYSASSSGNIPIVATFASNTGNGYLTVANVFYMTINTNGSYTPGSQITVTVNINDPESSNPSGLVNLYLNGTSYGSANAENGIATFTISLPSTAGTYNLTATYSNGESVSRNLIVSTNNGGNNGPFGPNRPNRPGDNTPIGPGNTGTQTVLNCDNYTQTEALSDGGYYTGKLLDTNGNAVIGQHISLTLTRTSSGASRTYDVVTDYNGQYSLQINLGAGEYSIKASYAGLQTDNLNYLSSESNTASIIVTKGTPVILSVSDYVSTYPGDGVFNKDFTGYLTYTNGTAVIGRHISLTLTRLSSGASKTYDTVCDYTGEFTLQIMLAPGDYTVNCSFADTGFESVSETVTMTITR